MKHNHWFWIMAGWLQIRKPPGKKAPELSLNHSLKKNEADR
jgi:hypothetical protein